MKEPLPLCAVERLQNIVTILFSAVAFVSYLYLYDLTFNLF
jgi:hypothetical protein|tara:strand:- start:2987 stop:3109 length:123 start_codon:yes stop_codon:yes gene_type:complete